MKQLVDGKYYVCGVHWLLFFCDTTPATNNWRKGFFWVPIPRAQSITAGKEWWQQWVGQLVAWHFQSGSRKRWTLVLAFSFSFFLFSFLVWSGIWPTEWCYPHLGLGFLSSVKLFWRHRQTRQWVCFHGDPKTSDTHDKEWPSRGSIGSWCLLEDHTLYREDTPLTNTQMFLQGPGNSKTCQLCLNDIN